MRIYLLSPPRAVPFFQSNCLMRRFSHSSMKLPRGSFPHHSRPFLSYDLISSFLPAPYIYIYPFSTPAPLTTTPPYDSLLPSSALSLCLPSHPFPRQTSPTSHKHTQTDVKREGYFFLFLPPKTGLPRTQWAVPNLLGPSRYFLFLLFFLFAAPKIFQSSKFKMELWLNSAEFICFFHFLFFTLSSLSDSFSVILSLSVSW